MNTKLLLQYDGSRYHGFQRQKNGVTVQETLEDTLTKVLKQPIQVTGCSRTDAGVHALQYVCNFRGDHAIPFDKVPVAVNTRLPYDIRVLAAEEAAEDFHARFSARSKTYLYVVWNRPTGSPFLWNYAYHFGYPVDAEKMREAAKVLVGTHDFSAFMSSGGSQKTTVRTVNRLTVTEQGPYLFISINADAYLYNMVRIIAGTLLYVGCGRMQTEEVADLLVSGKRKLAGITAGAEGLYLQEIHYEEGVTKWQGAEINGEECLFLLSSFLRS